MKMFKSLLLDLIKSLLLVLGVAFVSYGTHTSKLHYSAIGGVCLGLYDLIKK